MAAALKAGLTPLQKIEALRRARDEAIAQAAQAKRQHIAHVERVARCDVYLKALELNEIDNCIPLDACASMRLHIDEALYDDTDRISHKEITAILLDVRHTRHNQAEAAKRAVDNYANKPPADGVDYITTLLPDEMVAGICMLCGIDDLRALRLVCRRFRAVFDTTLALRRRLFATRFQTKKVHFSPIPISTSGNTAVNHIPGQKIFAILPGQDGRLYIQKGSYLYTIDVVARALVSKLRLRSFIPDAGTPTLMAVSPGGDLFIHSITRQTMYVVNTATNTVTTYPQPGQFTQVLGALSATRLVHRNNQSILFHDYSNPDNPTTVCKKLDDKHHYPNRATDGVYYTGPSHNSRLFLDFATFKESKLPKRNVRATTHCRAPGHPTLGFATLDYGGASPVMIRVCWHIGNDVTMSQFIETNIPYNILSIQAVGTRLVVLCTNGCVYVC
jgi:hypothetical protein